MTTTGETAGSNELRVEMILGCIASNPTNHSLDVVTLSRPLCILYATVIGADHSITGLEKGGNDGTKIGSSLAAVAHPGTSVDVYHNGILVGLRLGHVDIHGVEGLAIVGIVNVTELLGTMHVLSLNLLSSEAELRMGIQTK